MEPREAADRTTEVTRLLLSLALDAEPIRIEAYFEATLRHPADVLREAVTELSLNTRAADRKPLPADLRDACRRVVERRAQGSTLRRLEAGDGSPLLRDLPPDERAAAMATLRASVRRIGSGA